MSQMPSVSVYVGHLDPNVDERILFDYFKDIGSIVSVRVCSDSQTHRSLKYGYVNFQNPADAEAAIDKLNTTQLLNSYIRVSRVERDPSKRRAGRGNVVVKNLPPQVDVPDLQNMFSKFGRITSINVATNDDGSSRGYGHVMFESVEAAQEAIKEMNGMMIGDKTIEVVAYRHDYHEEKKRNFTNLYVRNLSPDVTDEQFLEHFSKCGETTSVVIRRDPATGASRKFGFAAFKTHEGAEKAIEMYDGKIVPPLSTEDTPLHVARFKNKRERERELAARRQHRALENAKFPNLYVKNFDEDVTSDNLRDLFNRCGETVSVRVMIDPTTKISRCFGFVSVKDQATAERCLRELNNSTILGPRPLYVTPALKKESRRQQLEERQRRSHMNMGYPQLAMGPMGVGSGPMFSNLRGMPHPAMGPQMGNMMMHAPPRGPMNMRRPMPSGPIRPQMMPPQPMQPPPQQSLATLLATVPPEQQQNMLGERLYTYIAPKHPNDAAKVTGMLLEMDNSEILNLLESPLQLDSKINEALEVLRRHQGAL